MMTTEKEKTQETVVTKDGTSINIYIGGQPTGQVTPTNSAINGVNLILWGLIGIVAIPMLLAPFGLSFEGVKNTWRQWQMNWMQPVPPMQQMQPAPIVMVTPPQQWDTPVVADAESHIPEQPIAPPPSAEASQDSPLQASPLQPVAFKQECTLSTGRVVTGLRGYSRPVADSDIKYLPKQVCHRHCIMQIESAAQVELLNDNRDMRLVGSWYSTGQNCNASFKELDDNSGVQKTFLSLIPLGYGYVYAYEELQKKLKGGSDNNEEKKLESEQATGAGWSLWDLLPESVKGLGLKGLALLVAGLLLVAALGGLFGRVIAIVVVGVILWYVFW